MFLRCEEQGLGVVEQLSPLLDRHYGQIGACHGGILYSCMDIQYSENARLHRYCGRNAPAMRTDRSLEPDRFSSGVAMPRPNGKGDATLRRNGEMQGRDLSRFDGVDFDVLCSGYHPRSGIMDQITQLDDSIERVSRIADELEQQVAPCPVSRLRLITWVTDWVGSPSRLDEVEQGLPSISQSLVSAYTAWVHASDMR